MNAPTIRGPVKAMWEGQEYVLSLRTAPDGYFSGADRAAAETIAATFQDSGRSAFTDESTASALCDLVVRVHRDGARVDPPWESWLDLPAEAIDTLEHDFFFCSIKKCSQWVNSPRTTAILTVLVLIYGAKMPSGTRSPAPPQPYGMRSGIIATDRGPT